MPIRYNPLFINRSANSARSLVACVLDSSLVIKLGPGGTREAKMGSRHVKEVPRGKDGYQRLQQGLPGYNPYCSGSNTPSAEGKAILCHSDFLPYGD